MATLSNWSENLPSDSSLVVKAPDYVRSIWRDTAIGLAESLDWPGSGEGSNASQGSLKLGKTKTWFEPESAYSYLASATHRARLFFASDTSRLFIGDTSTSTHFYGSPFFSEHTEYFAGALWEEKTGSYTTNTGAAGAVRSGLVSLTAGGTYAGEPIVFAYSDDTNVHVSASPLSLTTAFFSFVSGAAGSVTIRWTSLGTINV